MIKRVAKAKSVRKALRGKRNPNRDADDICATIAFYYSYTLAEARRLPYKDVVKLMRTIKREKSSHYFTLTQITAAPYSKNHNGLKKLSESFKENMKD